MIHHHHQFTTTLNDQPIATLQHVTSLLRLRFGEQVHELNNASGQEGLLHGRPKDTSKTVNELAALHKIEDQTRKLKFMNFLVGTGSMDNYTYQFGLLSETASVGWFG